MRLRMELFVGDLDAAYRSCREAGAVVEGLTDRPWGLTGFRITDPDGHYIRLTSAITSAVAHSM